METVFIVVVIASIGIIAVALMLWSQHVEKKRSEDMRSVAEALGLAFFEAGHDQLLSRLKRFQLFNSGRGRTMKNVILGETEVATISIFDYRYTTGSGKNKTTYVQTVVAMESDSLTLPSFTMRPEHLFDRVGSALGFQDIDFADHPQFSKQFVLKGEDEAAIREFFDAPLLDFFAARSGIHFECAPGMFIYFVARQKQKVANLRKFLEDGYSVYQAFSERLSRK